MERARQSDTWALAAPEARPWLLMMWATAWEQTPCGSLPNDDELIAARIGMQPKAFAKMKPILLRKWWLADDARLYHDVLVLRVMEMMQTRRKESDRKALARARTAVVFRQPSHGTTTGLHPESDTGTGTGTGSKQGFEVGEERDPPEDPGLQGHTRTLGGEVCLAIKAAGIPDVNPSHPDLQRLLAAGVTPQDLADTAAVLVLKGKSSFAYLLKTVEGQRVDAAAKAAIPAAVAPLGPTVPSSAADKTAELLRQQSEREATKPPAEILALASRAVRTA